jgi:alpha-tubulin suppressor-like RCC1 family protein
MLSQYIFLHNSAGAKNDSIGIKELPDRSEGPQRVLLPEKISEVHTNDHVALFYSKMTNTLYACGSFIPGYTAGGPPVKLHLKNSPSIKQISIWKNCVILTEEGDIFSDIESNGNIRLFSNLKDTKFSCICAGYGNAYAVDSSSGQVVKLAANNRIDALPTNHALVSCNDSIISMCSGYDQVISVTNNGNAYGTGYGHHGKFLNFFL